MHRAYRGRPRLGGGRRSLSPANPDVAAGDGHRHHQTPRAPSTGTPYRAIKNGRSRSVAISREPMRTGTAALYPDSRPVLG